MKTQDLEERIWNLSMEMSGLRAENKLLKSIIVSLMEALHKPVVGGPGSDVWSEGEQLGNEGSAKSVCGGDNAIQKFLLQEKEIEKKDGKIFD